MTERQGIKRYIYKVTTEKDLRYPDVGMSDLKMKTPYKEIQLQDYKTATTYTYSYRNPSVISIEGTGKKGLYEGYIFLKSGNQIGFYKSGDFLMVEQRTGGVIDTNIYKYGKSWLELLTGKQANYNFFYGAKTTFKPNIFLGEPNQVSNKVAKSQILDTTIQSEEKLFQQNILGKNVRGGQLTKVTNYLRADTIKTGFTIQTKGELGITELSGKKYPQYIFVKIDLPRYKFVEYTPKYKDVIFNRYSDTEFLYKQPSQSHVMQDVGLKIGGVISKGTPETITSLKSSTGVSMKPLNLPSQLARFNPTDAQIMNMIKESGGNFLYDEIVKDLAMGSRLKISTQTVNIPVQAQSTGVQSNIGGFMSPQYSSQSPFPIVLSTPQLKNKNNLMNFPIANMKLYPTPAMDARIFNVNQLDTFNYARQENFNIAKEESIPLTTSKNRLDNIQVSPQIVTEKLLIDEPGIKQPVYALPSIPFGIGIGNGIGDFRLPFGGGGRGNFMRATARVGFKPKYFASLEALAFNIRGKAPKNLTGLELRPIGV